MASEKSTEVRVFGDDHSVVCECALEDRLVVGCLQPKLSDMDNIVTLFSQELGDDD